MTLSQYLGEIPLFNLVLGRVIYRVLLCSKNLSPSHDTPFCGNMISH
jgi:hypothetical protein